MKTNYVLIDYENVQVKSLALLKGEHFRVKIFLGPTNVRLPIDLVLAMHDLGGNAEYIVLENPGNNALDFHIAYTLGVLSTTDSQAFFHVISRDTGFDPLLRYLKSHQIFAMRSASIEEMPCFGSPATRDQVSRAKADVPVESPAAKPATMSDEDLLRIAVVDLIKRKASKPRTPKTLKSTLQAKLGKDVLVERVDAVFAGMVKRGYVKIDGTKVSYALPAA